ncbi:MAG: sugar transferase [Saprospiraceae bacterium]|nr:sugar transferase [Saprospiraceae bacterium]
MYKRFLKRLIDFFVALFVLVLFSPLIFLVIIGLYLFNGKKVFFTQSRPGKNGKIFTIYKFKTMNDQRDNDGRLLPDEARLTMIGRFIRSTSLDELPQLFNVLRGDMSLVGPRPLLEKYIPLYSKQQFRRHEVKPGITGWAQVNGRNNISWSKKFELDVWYVDNQSFLLDLKITFMTILKVIRRKDITSDEPNTFQPFNGSN